MNTRGNSTCRRLRSLLALALSLLYLFGPLQHEVGETLHTFSHWVESLHHLPPTGSSADSLHPHTYSRHRLKQEVHTHEGIVWVDHFLMNASHTSDHEKAPLEKPGIDKHLFSVTSFFISVLDEASQKSADLTVSAANGHSSSCFRPPRT